ncbi:MAG: GNAT family N-acetyltransferase [Clostridia bacterium]|nr:GNAT family N-acetyltransferase [Clostridia bacterium]
MIRTTRLYLRELTPNDSKAYYSISSKSDDVLYKYAVFFSTKSEKNAKEFIFEYYNSSTSLLYGVFLSDDTLVGAILLNQNFYNRNYINSIEVSYFIGKSYRNNGYITEALQEIIKYYSGKKLFLESLKFSVKKGNISSIRVLEKIGCEFYKKSEYGEYLRYKKHLTRETKV